jgi:hypothetical protein
MFPNPRIMFVAVIAAVAAFGGGFGVFAALRLSHQPFARGANGGTSLRFFNDPAEQAGEDMAPAPFGVRFRFASQSYDVAIPVPVHGLDALPPPAHAAEPAAGGRRAAAATRGGNAEAAKRRRIAAKTRHARPAPAPAQDTGIEDFGATQPRFQMTSDNPPRRAVRVRHAKNSAARSTTE